MMCILTINRWSRVTIYCFVMIIACHASAQEAMWTPKLGTVTTLQSTDIKLVSQKAEFVNLAPIYHQGRQIWAFSGEAEYYLVNTSRSKKKPTVLLRLCSVNERFNPQSSCALKITDLKIKVDGREIDWSPFLKESDVFARFPLKFGSRMGRKVVISHQLFERGAGDLFADNDNYLTFDYHIEDSAAWDGPVGSTLFSIKLPFKSSPFSAKVFSAGMRFLYKNRLAYFSKRKLEPNNSDELSFYVVTASYRNKVDRFRKRLRAIPSSPKRHLALASILAAYPGGHREISKHVGAALKKKLKGWEASDVENATSLYSKYLIALYEFKEMKAPCDPNICIAKSTLQNIIDSICRSNRCKQSNHKELSACCAPKDSQESLDFLPGNAIDAIEADTEEEMEEPIETANASVHSNSDIGNFLLRYAFLLLMGALLSIGLISWIVLRIVNRDKQPPYRKTLHD